MCVDRGWLCCCVQCVTVYVFKWFFLSRSSLLFVLLFRLLFFLFQFLLLYTCIFFLLASVRFVQVSSFFFNILLNTDGDETGSKNVKNRVCHLVHSACSSYHDILFRVCHLNLRKNRLVVPRGPRVSWCATICFNERLTKCYPEAGVLCRVKIAATMSSKSATRNELSHPRAYLYPFLTPFKYFPRF